MLIVKDSDLANYKSFRKFIKISANKGHMGELLAQDGWWVVTRKYFGHTQIMRIIEIKEFNRKVRKQALRIKIWKNNK